jgi:hypothetical protein
MKRLAVLCLLSGSMSGALFQSALAQGNPTITVDENGAGSLVFPGGGTTPTTGALLPDPGPGGLSSALTYNLLGPPGLVAGDLLIGDGVVAQSDIVRFNPAGTGNPAYPASLVFYSLPGEGALADTGLPSAVYANNVFMVEGADGVVTYTPTAGQPGFVPGFGVTYVVKSSPETAPDPGSSAALLSVALTGLVWFRRASR